jgi:hypothetical protein
VYLLLLPVWILATLVTWRRSQNLLRGYRITLVIVLTLAMFSLAQGLTFYVVAGKLDSLGTAPALLDARYNRLGSYAALALSAMSLVVFLFLVTRRRTRREDNAYDLTNRWSRP